MKKLAIGLLGLLTCLAVSATETEGPIKLTKDIALFNELKLDDTHIYSLNVRKNQFVLGHAQQMGSDVVISIYDPDGNLLQSFDETGRWGYDGFHFVSQVAGDYIIKVSPFKNRVGKYSLTVTYSAPVASTPEGKLDQFMSGYGDDSPGAVLAVMRQGKLILAKGYGLANVEYNIPNTISTPYHLASVSKQFTAFAILLLAKDGKLQLDDDVRKYLPQLPDYGNVITIRHLLNHTSGLRDHWNLWLASGQIEGDVIRQQDLLWLIERQRELNNKPGNEHVYSNSNYLLLAEIVSTVTNENFGKWMKDNVFEPLGMRSTQVYDNYEKIVKERAYSYHDTDNGLKKYVLSNASTGSTGLLTTIEDLFLWIKNFHSGDLGGKELVEELQTPGVLNNGDTINYAAGVYIGEQDGLKKLFHSGLDAGFQTLLTYYPEIDSGVIVLSNYYDLSINSINLTLTDLFLKKDMQQWQEQQSKRQDQNSTGTKEPGVPEYLAEALTGKFATKDQQQIYTLYVQGGNLVAYIEGRPRSQLLNLGNNEFLFNNVKPETKIKFHSESNGDVNSATIFQGEEISLERLLDWEPEKKELSQYIGRYYSDEVEAYYSIIFDGDQLAIQHRKHGVIPITPTTKDNFDTRTGYLGYLKFEKDKSGDFIDFRMSTGRVRNLKFKKVD